MFSKKAISPIYGVTLGLSAAMFITFFVFKDWHLSTPYTALLFVVCWVLFGRLGVWIMVEHPEDLQKKYPITSKELRARRDRFFSELDAQNPPRPKHRNSPPP